MSDPNLRSSSSEDKRRVTMASSFGKEELAVSTPSQRNWRGILIALLVIVAVLGLILCAIMMLMPLDDGPRVKGTLFTINSGQFSAKLFNGTWVSETELVYMDHYGGITVLCAENMTTRQLMTNLSFRQINAEDYRVSADLNFVLLMTDIIPLWTHSYKAKHYIYDVASQVATPLLLASADLDEYEVPYIESVIFTPTGNGVAFVYNNDVYYKPNVRKSQEYRLTSFGVPGMIFNGRPDYLYETRILGVGTAMWFSPDSTMLLYATFNCTEVGTHSYAFYGDQIYEEIRTIRYPKAGSKNPTVQLTVVDVQRPKYPKYKTLKPPSFYEKESNSGGGQGYYMTGVRWIGLKEVAATWMNRRQNFTSVSTCVAPDFACIDNFTMPKAATRHWVNQIHAPIFDRNLTSFLSILPMPEGDKNGGYLQVFQVNSTSTRYAPLTVGTLTVIEILSWDLHNHFVYFIAAAEPARRQLFRAGDLDNIRSMECLTCWEENSTSIDSGGKQKLEDGRSELINTTDDTPASVKCSYAKAYFNAVYNPKFYVLECLGPDVPSSVLVDIATNTIVFTFDTNAELQNLFASMAKPQIKTLQVEIENGHNAQVRLFLPPGLREYEDMTFPLILHVDSEPGSQLVTDKYHVDWFWYLAGKRNFIVAQIDARGTGCQGEKIIQEIFFKLGTHEVDDQITVTSYLRSALRYIDPQRIAIIGEGYGGYLTTMILAKDDNKVFKCGVAVNPISSFRHTDSFFTERYMGMPNGSDNYSDAELHKRVGNLKDKDLLLISSTANPAVPFIHTAKLVQALVKEGVQYRHQVYPDIGSDLSAVSEHYYNLVDSFWDECFKPLDFYDWETMGSFIPFSKE